MGIVDKYSLRYFIIQLFRNISTSLNICQNIEYQIFGWEYYMTISMGFMSYVWKHVIKNYWCRNIYRKSKVSVQSVHKLDFRKVENCTLLDLCYGCWKKIDYKLCFTSRWSGSIVFLDKNRSICFFYSIWYWRNIAHVMLYHFDW